MSELENYYEHSSEDEYDEGPDDEFKIPNWTAYKPSFLEQIGGTYVPGGTEPPTQLTFIPDGPKEDPNKPWQPNIKLEEEINLQWQKLSPIIIGGNPHVPGNLHQL